MVTFESARGITPRHFSQMPYLDFLVDVFKLCGWLVSVPFFCIQRLLADLWYGTVLRWLKITVVCVGGPEFGERKKQ